MAFTLVTRAGTLVTEPKAMSALALGFLRGVVACNQMTIRAAKQSGRPIPPLYESGVRYRVEPWDYEEFADVLTVLSRGWGDCDDLVCWRVAELAEQGEKCKIKIYWRDVPNGVPRLYHCELQRANGHVEDPSRFLGL